MNIDTPRSNPKIGYSVSKVSLAKEALSSYVADRKRLEKEKDADTSGEFEYKESTGKDV